MWKKVVAPTALVSVIWVLVSCATSHTLNRLDESQTLLLNMNRNVIRASGAMQENLWRLQVMLFEAAEHKAKQSSLHDKCESEARQLEAAFDAALADAKQNASTADEQALTKIISENFERYRSEARTRFDREGPPSEEGAGPVSAAMQLARAVAKPCEDLSELAQRLTNESFQRRDQIRMRVNVARIAFTIIGPAIGILLGLRVARGLNYSISQISVKLRDVSGDLEQDVGLVEVSPSGEVGDLPALQEQVQYVSGRIKQVVEELQWARRKAIESKRLAAIGELAAGVAHEVRNPLTSVKLLIQAIERNPALGPGDGQRLRIVQEEIARIETILQELLDYARPPTLRRLRHDVRDTLRRTLNLVAVRAQQCNVSIEESLGVQPLMVDADPEQLQQVFINLLLNAIEAMPAGGKLFLSVELPGAASGGRSSNSMLRITFSDTGSGIRADVMQRLFEPFVTSKERGIGLGLAISRQIMQEHGGRLTASNSTSGGAKFVVEAPLAEAAATVPIAGGIQPPMQALEKARAETIETVNH